VSFLDYFPLTNLCQTNHYFRNLISRDHIKHALLEFERRTAGGSQPLNSFEERLLKCQWIMTSTYLPCYKCLRGLPSKRYFLTSQTTGRFALGESAASRRKCSGCYFNGRATWLKNSEVFFTEGSTWIDCVRCKQTKRFLEGRKDLSNLAWIKGRCCFYCYRAERGSENGEVTVVPYEPDGNRERS
jgi:hypothetical protein